MCHQNNFTLSAVNNIFFTQQKFIKRLFRIYRNVWTVYILYVYTLLLRCNMKVNKLTKIITLLL